MKNKRDDRQQLEEKNIDYSTKNKILTSRINLANNEANKAKIDQNKKNDTLKALVLETEDLYSLKLRELNRTNSNIRKSLNHLKDYDRGNCL